MKILVLMPLDEKWSIMSAAIWQKMDMNAKQKTFVMPYFMDWAVQTGKSENWIYALFDSLISASVEYNNSGADDLIILGNCNADLKFDAVFNFQDMDESLPYEDKNIEKVKELVKDDPQLLGMVSNLHTAAESKLALKDCAAAAEFLSAYLKTDPHLDEIRAKYEDRLGELKKLNGENFYEAIKNKNSGGNA